MKNLNVKNYHQPYHPYNLPSNSQHQQQLQIQQHLQNLPFNTTVATPTQRFNNNNLPTTTNNVGTKVTTNSPLSRINNSPPTFGGYLANQQRQRVLQQHQQQQHNLTTEPQTQQQQINMLSLNQTNTYNYNFQFNAANSINNNNNHSHNNNALSRPQRPSSLNISAMPSLATPGTFSATASANSSCHSASMTTSGFSCNPNQYYNNHRDNVFNFPINQQQQQQYNLNNYSHQQNYNNYNTHHNQQQQQQQHQQLQQFQLLQQQLKQHQFNNICDLTTSISSSCIVTSAAPCAIPAPAVANTNTPTQSTNSDNNNCQNGINNNNNINNNCDKLTMDACEIANFLANELFMQQLVSMECMQTGVPTLTTPTLTPTTLKSIEESFIQLTSEPINAPYQAGFIPPPLGSYNSITSNTTNNNTINNNNNNNSTIASVTTTVAGVSPNTTMNNVFLGDISTGASLHDYANLNESDTENSQGSWNDNHLNEENSMATSDNSSGATDTTSFQNGLSGMGVNTLNNSNSSTTNDFSGVNLTAIAVATAAAKMSGCGNNNTSASATTVTPRRGGGRRPATNSNMSPEEEEKRRIRRERNKLAAARCRKRRVDQTNELTDEVQLLEKKREELQKQIESLNGTKQNLEFLLEAHRPTCQRLENADILLVNTFSGLMPSSTTSTTTNANDNITGLDTSLATTARSISPLDLKPVLNDHLLAQIKSEPLDATLDSNSSLDQDGPTSPKRLLMHNNNPMIPPPLPNVATLSASLAAASASLNTPIQTTAPVSFASMYSNNPTLNAPLTKHNSKQRPNSLPTVPRNSAQSLALGVNDNKPPTDINGVAIQTPSTGMFNFDSLMDGGTGLTPVSGPLVPNCSSQNKHPLELVTPTSEPSKLVSL